MYTHARHLLAKKKVLYFHFFSGGTFCFTLRSILQLLHEELGMQEVAAYGPQAGYSPGTFGSSPWTWYFMVAAGAYFRYSLSTAGEIVRTEAQMVWPSG